MKFVIHFFTVNSRNVVVNAYAAVFLIVLFYIQILDSKRIHANYKSRHDYQISTALENDFSENIHRVVFSIKQRNLDLLRSMLDKISDPTSNEYAHYLDSYEIAQITANPVSTSVIINFLLERNIDIVHRTLHGEFITAETTISNWEAIFSNKFFIFEHSTGQRPSVHRALHYILPSELESHICTVFNVIHLPLPEIRLQSMPRQPSSNFKSSTNADAVGVITPALLNSVLNIPSNVGDPAVTQAIYGTNNAYFSQDDLTLFQSEFGVPNHPVDSDPSNRNNPSDCSQSTNTCGEANLDLQYITAIAQNTHTTFIYDPASDAFISWLTSTASMESPPMVQSISYGVYESDIAGYSNYALEFNIQAMKVAAMGVTLVAASGDDGAPGAHAEHDSSRCGYDPIFPASSPYVVAVGATMGAELGQTQVACQADLGGDITTGGGFSTIAKAPLYQRPAILNYFASLSSPPQSGYNTTGRGIPDLVLPGKSFSIVTGGKTHLVSGTSASAPVFAGLVSLANTARRAAGKPPLGMLGPVLYADSADFAVDVVSGSNTCTKRACCPQGFAAAAGWDPVTGIGYIDFQKFQDHLVSL